MGTDTEPWWVAPQRANKADRLARSLLDIGVTAQDVTHLFTADDLREAEAAAAVNKGSKATWRLAVEMMCGSSNPDALCPTCGIGDPEGEIGPRKRYRHTGPCSQ